MLDTNILDPKQDVWTPESRNGPGLCESNRHLARETFAGRVGTADPRQMLPLYAVTGSTLAK